MVRTGTETNLHQVSAEVIRHVTAILEKRIAAPWELGNDDCADFSEAQAERCRCADERSMFFECLFGRGRIENGTPTLFFDHDIHIGWREILARLLRVPKSSPRGGNAFPSFYSTLCLRQCNRDDRLALDPFKGALWVIG